jgi:hypothetical protein
MFAALRSQSIVSPLNGSVGRCLFSKCVVSVLFKQNMLEHAFSPIRRALIYEYCPCRANDLRRSSKKNAPALKHVLKKFFLKVHPDHFAQYPTIAKANEASFQELQSFLQHIAGANDGAMPPAKNTPLTFYAWAPEKHVNASSGAATPAPKLRKIAVNLRTTGGDCRHLITKTLTDMFEQANVQPPVFSWGEAYWNDSNVCALLTFVFYLQVLCVLVFLLMTGFFLFCILARSFRRSTSCVKNWPTRPKKARRKRRVSPPRRRSAPFTAAGASARAGSLPTRSNQSA